MPSAPVVDMHTHFLPEVYLRRVERDADRLDVRFDRAPDGSPMIQARFYRTPVDERHRDIEFRIRAMAEQGVDLEILSPSPANMMLYWTEAALCEELAEAANEAYSGLVRAHPEHFLAVGTVPLQDVPRAVRVLERAVEKHGLLGAIIGSNVEGRYIDEEEFWPFFECAEALGARLIVHAYRFPDDALLKDYFLDNLAGFVFDEGVSAARLIYAGVLERFPRLKLCIVHGGGFFPILLGRLDHGYKVRPECRAAIPEPPSVYAERLYFDSITHSPKALSHLLAKAAPGHVLMGSDYPFDMGEDPPGRSIRDLPGLDEGTRRDLLGGNALRFFGVEGPEDG